MKTFFRTALRPQWIVLLLVVLVAATAMAQLGNWQLARARDQGSSGVEKLLARPPVPLTSVMRPQELFPADVAARPVTVQGTWDPAAQLVLPDRWREGTRGMWVLTPLVLADGSRLPVVRGWVDSESRARQSATDLPAGEVTLTGVMRPGETTEDYEPGNPPSPPPGELDAVDPVELIKLWPRPIFTGFLIQSAPAPGPDLVAVPPENGSGHLAFQNLSYALQWWLFAGLGLLFWFRLVRDDARGVFRRGEADPVSGDRSSSGTIV